MWVKWLPWSYLVKRGARAHGFIDPLDVLARVRSFAQPAEVLEPLELLRAGAAFHARGLINSRVIQHNLDWVWPYWVERQFDPSDDAFIPRSFTITHVNLTHRNWTAVGVPGCERMPIVDPRGLVTPHDDAWSIDGWVVSPGREALYPSRSKRAKQSLDMSENLAVVTACGQGSLELEMAAEVQERQGGPVCVLRYQAKAPPGAYLAVSLRPYNPEGVSFIHEVEAVGSGWVVNGKDSVRFSVEPDRTFFSTYADGDVSTLALSERIFPLRAVCKVGMATAAALFRVDARGTRSVVVEVPYEEKKSAAKMRRAESWKQALEPAARLRVPDAAFSALYEASLRALVLHTPGEIFPGPYTYKRFWFRDAAFILNALMCAGLLDRARRCLDRFPGRQTRDGYFLSQSGEWDANGEALWAFERYCGLSARAPDPAWRRAIEKGADWLVRKRLADEPRSPHAGLLPAGFSAEHFGPSDFYYWDDFWAAAGLDSAASLLKRCGAEDGRHYRHEAKDFLAAIERSLAASARGARSDILPASPYRRPDAASIGNLVADYPLRIFPAGDPRMLATAGYLIDKEFLNGAFFHDVVHSGLNAYLSLHIAQVLLRAGDPRFFDIVAAVADLASPTGQWPEAVHPRTRGGCMGDGQHAWASAEWVMMIRNMFVREENGGRLAVATGIPDHWLAAGETISFGPAPTEYGPVSVSVRIEDGSPAVSVRGDWFDAAPRLETRAPFRIAAGFRMPADPEGAKERIP